MRVLAASILLLLCCSWDRSPAILGPFSAAFNVPADLIGTPDTRPGTWGLATSYSVPYVFSPPAGYRVRILHMDGNYYAFARGVYPRGLHVGISWGTTTTAPSGSQRVTLSADNCFVYGAFGLSNGEVNQAFNLDVAAGGLLESDNTFNLISAVFLNDRQISVHMETTGVMKYQFERID